MQAEAADTGAGSAGGTPLRGRPPRKTPSRAAPAIWRTTCERLVEATAARWRDVPIASLRKPHRSIASVARTRQSAMYLVHVVFSARLTAAARLFGRDRTTASHACQVIEGWREDPRVDRSLECLERAMRAWSAAFNRTERHMRDRS